MATTYKTVEVWVVIDSDGDYDVGPDRESADERYTETIADFGHAAGIRRVKVTVTVPLPTVIEVEAECEGDEEPVAA